ncbi:MAG: ABC transporter permease [Desulfobacteraceae bacterium]|jgi:phospholipid/cholesterol/gamma-HCH transport system permease protein
MKAITGYIGRKTIKCVNRTLDLFAFSYRILKLLFIRQKVGSALVQRVVIEQIYFTAVQALPILIPTALFVGWLQIFQSTKFAGQVDLEKTIVFLIIREVGPLITALLVILRSATAVTVEISYMNVLHEMDALEMAGIDPFRIVCLPRLVGITSAILSLFVVFDIVSILGGYMVVWVSTHIPLGNFLSQISKAITATDIWIGILKAVCFGFTITVISLYHGFGIQRQITYIPMATSRASVECFLYCLIVDIFISTLFYL